MADQTKPRQDEDVNLGVAKKPEQVHIEHRVPTSPWVESGGVSVAIGEEHRDGTRKHGQGEQEQKVGDEHAPHKQGNSQHFLTRAAHVEDCGDSVDGAGKAAEPGQMEAKDGDVACHSLSAEGRVDGPPNTSADLHEDRTQEKQERRRQRGDGLTRIGAGQRDAPRSCRR